MGVSYINKRWNKKKRPRWIHHFPSMGACLDREIIQTSRCKPNTQIYTQTHLVWNHWSIRRHTQWLSGHWQRCCCGCTTSRQLCCIDGEGSTWGGCCREKQKGQSFHGHHGGGRVCTVDWRLLGGTDHGRGLCVGDLFSSSIIQLSFRWSLWRILISQMMARRLS